jgi:hypothetical protein
MPLKVESVILDQYWPMLVVWAASNDKVRKEMCTASVSSVRAGDCGLLIIRKNPS